MKISGKRLAVIGVSLAVAAGMALWGSLSAAQRDATGAVTKQGDETVFKVRLGDCIVDWTQGVASSLVVTPCTQPHLAQIYGESTMTGSEFPGEAAADAEAEKQCTDKESALSAATPSDASIAYLRPTKDSWAKADRTISCVVVTTAKGSVSLLAKDGATPSPAAS